MFTRTSWRITSWNGNTGSITIVIGLAGGTLEIRLSHGSQSHNLLCAGIGASLGVGGSIRDVSLPSGLLGFQTPSRTDWGTLYKNNLAVPGPLTYELLHDSHICVTGVELPLLDEGVSAYVVLFASGTATAASMVASAGGWLAAIVAGATCRAITFLGAPARGIPGAAAAGYRYRIIGGS